ncbi:MAG: MYG1 family protein [Candidatus Paceibacterota bacterium]
MSFFNKKKICVTHDGSFHADDLFATATLSILNNGNIKIIRTRDEEWFKKGDYVYDVGGIYNPEINRFDHHQEGGAGNRENSTPYSSFGLVWEKYGERICESKVVANKIEERLVQSIDANDNGINLFETKGEVAPYLIQDIFFNFRPTWKEKQDYDSCFMKLVPFVVEILKREIIQTKDRVEAESIVKKAYEEAEDKKIIFFDGTYPWFETINEYSEPLYVISKKGDTWRAEAVRKEKYKFETKKPFPEIWAGKRDNEMAKVSGVSDAIFCHNGRFLVVAKTKEGVIELVKKALLA